MSKPTKYGVCIPLEDTAKQKLEKKPRDPDSLEHVVTYVTQRWKCSTNSLYLHEEEEACNEVSEECELLTDNEEEEKEVTELEESCMSIEEVKLIFERYMKTT